MDEPTLQLVAELVEKVGLLKREIEHRQERTAYEARLVRIEQKVDALVEALAATSPAHAKAVRAAWHTPARSLAFRNAAHQKER